jgi:hypothetical protein
MKTQKKGGDGKTFDSDAVQRLEKYSSFPAYPTSFVVAADTTIEVSVSFY